TMTESAKQSGGRAARKPVVYGGRRRSGMYERKVGNRVVFEVRRKIAGKMVRHTLKATTPTEAIREHRKWVADLDAAVRLIGRGDESLLDLRNSWEELARSPGSPYAP